MTYCVFFSVRFGVLLLFLYFWSAFPTLDFLHTFRLSYGSAEISLVKEISLVFSPSLTHLSTISNLSA